MSGIPVELGGVYIHGGGVAAAVTGVSVLSAFD